MNYGTLIVKSTEIIYLTLFTRAYMSGERAVVEKNDINILLVDDDTEYLNLEEIFLRKVNPLFNPVGVESAGHALERIRDDGFDVIVSDYMMPDTDGLEFLRILREEYRTDIPFIMLTGRGREEVAMKTLNLEGDRYIQKGGAPKAQFAVLAQAIEQEIEHYKTKKKLAITKHSVDKASDGIFWVDSEGKFLYTNERVSSRLGYDSDGLKEMYVWDIDPDYPKGRRKKNWDRLKEKGYIKTESVYVARDGTQIPVEIYSNYIEHDGNEMEIAFVRDITERKIAEERIMDLNSLLMAIRNVNQLIVQEDDLLSMMKGSCDILLKARNYMNIGIAVLDERRDKIAPLTNSGVHNIRVWKIDREGRGNAPRCVKEVVASGKTIIIDDPAIYCKDCEYLEEDSVHHTVLIPMTRKDRIMGILTACMAPGHMITREEIDLLEEVAGDLAFAWDKLKADRRLKEKNRLLSAINEYSLELAAVPISKDIFAIATKKLKELADAKVVSFSTYDKSKSELVVQYTTLSEEKNKKLTKFLGRRVEGLHNKVTPEMYDRITSEVVGDAGTLHETTFGTISKPVGKIIEKLFGVEWFTGIALLYKGELMGTVIISGGKETKRPDNEELRAFAGVTANAVRRWMVERSQLESQGYCI